MESFASFLKRKRNENNLTQGQVETYGRISHSLYSQLETGERKTAKNESLLKIAKGLRADPLEVLAAAGVIPEEKEPNYQSKLIANSIDPDTPQDEVEKIIDYVELLKKSRKKL